MYIHFYCYLQIQMNYFGNNLYFPIFYNNIEAFSSVPPSYIYPFPPINPEIQYGNRNLENFSQKSPTILEENIPEVVKQEHEEQPLQESEEVQVQIKATKRIQNPLRNDKSNVLKMFIRYVQSKEIQSFVNSTIEENSLRYSLDKFLSDVNEIFKRFKNYVRPSLIKKITSRKYQNTNLSILIKKLLKQYVAKELPLQYIKKQNRKRRYLAGQIKTISNQLLALIPKETSDAE